MLLAVALLVLDATFSACGAFRKVTYAQGHPAAVLGLTVATLALLFRRTRLRAERAKTSTPKRTQNYGPYQVLQKLGDGATGEVFLGEDPGSGKAALKVLREEHGKKHEFKVRFEREADICKNLKHPRIVKTYAWGVQDNRYWMAQEYLPGENLGNWVKASGMHPRDVERVLLQICVGLEYAHAMGIFHRDLKPANLLLNAKGEVVIGDFGLARRATYETITAEEDVLGTPAYMSPEQAQGMRPDKRSDLYSVGIIGYQLLSGRVPFEGTIVEVLMGQLSKIPVPLNVLKPGLPPKLSGVVMRLLEKDPNRRYQTSSEVIEALSS